MAKRPRNLAERLLRISRLHIFELYLFRCVLFTQDGCVWRGVANVERVDGQITLTFEKYKVVELLQTDSYAIIDDEDFLVAQRYFDSEKTYHAGDIVSLSFEVKCDA